MNYSYRNAYMTEASDLSPLTPETVEKPLDFGPSSGSVYEEEYPSRKANNSLSPIYWEMLG